MAYVVLLSEQSKTELTVIKKSGDKATINKIAKMLLELQEHPRTGTGQVEHLKHFIYPETGLLVILGGEIFGNSDKYLLLQHLLHI